MIESAPVPGRYRFHDLLRLYALERLNRDEAERDRNAALTRMLGWYLDTAEAAYRLIRPGRRRLPRGRTGKPPDSPWIRRVAGTKAVQQG